MGATGSKIDLRRENISKNLISGGLVNVLNYLNRDETLASVEDALIDNWESRGANANKENIFVIASAATSGQGKTELCRQLVFESEAFASRLGLLMMIPVLISFNQTTTFSLSELKEPVEKAIIWRSLYAFGIKDCEKVRLPRRLVDLTNEIRKQNSHGDEALQSIGIFFLVDEILKVYSEDESFYRNILNVMSNLQQQQLREGYPTFLFVTSLELTPLSREIVSKSGRKLKLVPMPFLRDMDLDMVSNKLHEEMKEILGLDGEVEPSRRKEQHLLQYQVKLLIRLMVSISGRHFRCLEEATKSLYSRLVSPENHQKACDKSSLTLPKLCKPSREAFQAARTKRSIEDIDISVKEIFSAVVAEVLLCDPTQEDYARAIDLFLDLMNDPGGLVNESPLYDLEAKKIVFVKSRNPDNPTSIVPRVNLPFLFRCPLLKRRFHYETYGPAIARSGEETQEYLLLREPASLKIQVGLLLRNVGVALATPFHELPRALEDVMVFVELLTVAGRCRDYVSSSSGISLENLIPKILFKPWSNESLNVSSFVIRNQFRVCCRVSVGTDTTSTVSAASSAPTTAVVKEAIRLACDPQCDMVYLTQGSINMSKIEHISRLFAVRDKPVLCLCSMKLQQKSNPVRLARDMHQFVATEVNHPGDLLLPYASYYAVVYCCTEEANINLESIPPGTIIVGIRSIRELLHPFGLSLLVQVAEEKSKA